jgi:hypothetical protein
MAIELKMMMHRWNAGHDPAQLHGKQKEKYDHERWALNMM